MIPTPTIILYIACSLDGYIARKNGSVDWLSGLETESEDFGYLKFYASVDALIMGRKTYQQIVGFGEWPYPDKPCYVFSHRHLKLTIPDVVVVSDSLEKVQHSFKKKRYRRVWLVGGAELIKSYLNASMIHEMIITFIPLLLAEGIPLFLPGISEQKLILLGTSSFSQGVTQTHYRIGD